MQILKANLLGSFTFLALYEIVLEQFAPIPRSVFVIDGLLCFLMVSGTRVMARILMEELCSLLKHTGPGSETVLIVGAGAAGQTIAREIRQNPKLNISVLGYLDNDPMRHGQKFQGHPVLGSVSDLENVCSCRCVNLVIVAQPALCRKELKSLVRTCSRLKVRSKILPSVGEIIKDEVSIRHVRDVQLEDLLGRQPVRLDLDEIRSYLKGKNVLITGAGGSIGSEICRQIVNFAPAHMVILDNAETPLFHIDMELRSKAGNVHITPTLSDIRDRAKIRQVFAQHKPDVVFHAAAYKHVPMLEHHPAEAFINNVLGTRNLADTAHTFGVERFVMISSDKAVNPANIMGATKRAAEMYVQHLSRKSSTNFITVRFGNVLGSNGSVIPIFRDQIEKGGPVTVTHAEVTRYFMTIPEATQLVLQAGSMGKGGEIFLLDMGEPVRILDLAEEMIRLSGLQPYEDIDICFTGLRPGEKLYEELLLSGEDFIRTAHEKINISKSVPCNGHLLDEWIARAESRCQSIAPEEIALLLNELVPEFKNVRQLQKNSYRLEAVGGKLVDINPSLARTS